tara:strand:- start:139 stop:537 length:399 start_codon:yes stop_codon:yes gene_type:complete
MIGFPMLPGVAHMAKQAQDGMIGADMYHAGQAGQVLPVGNPAKTMNMMQPSTHDYFLKGWEDAGGWSSLPGMVGETISEMPFMNTANKVFPIPTGPGGQMIMPTGGPTEAGVMPPGTMTGIGGLLGEMLFNR